MAEIVVDFGVKVDSFIRVMRDMFSVRHVHLRELTQNSLEAINARRQLVPEFRGTTRLETDLQRGGLRVVDDGIGMTPEELATNFTRLFESGWSSLGGKSLGIGQFGFGFYSVFLVSSQVRVISRSVRSDHGPHQWRLDLETNQVHIAPFPGEHPFGTTVEVQLDEQHREGADGDFIRKALRETYLYTDSAIFIDGQGCGIPTTRQWHAQVREPARRSALVEWVQERYGWEHPPMLVHPLDGEINGWIAVGPASKGMLFSMPGVEVFRRGIRVLTQELLPKPLNYVMCGLVDADHLRLKPDREELQPDEAFHRMEGLLAEACNQALEQLAARPEAAESLFREYRAPVMDAMLRHGQVRRLLVDHLPLNVVQGGATRQSTLREYLEKRENRVVWTKDPLKDRVLADRAAQLHGPVLFLNEQELGVIRAACQERNLPLVSVAQEYLDDLRSNDQSSSLTPALRALRDLFKREWKDAVILLATDSDRRFPVQMVTLEQQPPRELQGLLAGGGEVNSPEDFLKQVVLKGLLQMMNKASEELVLVVNLNNRVIQHMAGLAESPDEAVIKTLRQAARTGIFLAGLQAGNNLPPEEAAGRVEEIWKLIAFRLEKKGKVAVGGGDVSG